MYVHTLVMKYLNLDTHIKFKHSFSDRYSLYGFDVLASGPECDPVEVLRDQLNLHINLVTVTRKKHTVVPKPLPPKFVSFDISVVLSICLIDVL